MTQRREESFSDDKDDQWLYSISRGSKEVTKSKEPPAEIFHIDDGKNDEGLACNDPQREGLLYKAYWGIFNLREGKKTLFENCCH